MGHPAVLKTFFIADKAVTIFVPHPAELAVMQQKQQEENVSFYWAKVWPAAIGLCDFLRKNIHYVSDRNVLELAAGPGLPGIYCAGYAKHVCISDIAATAVELVQRSVTHLQLKNVDCFVADWNDLSIIPIPEVVLLSDINYDPAQFEQLLLAIQFLLEKHCTIILSTPQRLMAKDFINQLLPFCKEQTEEEVQMEETRTMVSVFVLQK